MALPEDYLIYPHRTYGMDHKLYDWRSAPMRAPRPLPGGAGLAVMVVVVIEHHNLTPSSQPFKAPGAMVTPYPDLRHYTTRDYGNRVGVFRILEALKAAGIKATFPVNADQLQRLAPLIARIAADGHEIAAHGLSADRIHWGGLERQAEAAWIAEARARFTDAGLSPRAWLSPARQQSRHTLELTAQAGFDLNLDWEQDEVPVSMATAAGTVTALPLSNELDDRLLLIDKRHDEDAWADQVLAAADYLRAGADAAGGRMLGFTLTPYVSGQPFRILTLKRLLTTLGADPALWCAPAGRIADAFAEPAA